MAEKEKVEAEKVKAEKKDFDRILYFAKDKRLKEPKEIPATLNDGTVTLKEDGNFYQLDRKEFDKNFELIEKKVKHKTLKEQAKSLLAK